VSFFYKIDMDMKAAFIGIICTLAISSVFAENEKVNSVSPVSPSFSFGCGATIDISARGLDKKYIHTLFSHSPLQSKLFIVSTGLLLLGNFHIFQIRIPVTGTLQLFHFQWGKISPFFGGGIGFSLIDDPVSFFFLHSGFDFVIHPHLVIAIGNNFLFIGEDFLDTELFVSIALCF
jgi:hypothetical protein